MSLDKKFNKTEDAFSRTILCYIYTSLRMYDVKYLTECDVKYPVNV